MNCEHNNIKRVKVGEKTEFKCMDCWDMWDWEEYKIYFSNKARVHDYV